jgi:sirohydrochlorin ferrochelatase
MTDLIAAAHGTADPRGIQVIHALTREIARQRPAVPVSLGFVDVDTPALPSLVDRVVADSNRAVIVPLLLSSGYHVTTDIQSEARQRPNQITAASPLGPHPVLAPILADRLTEALTDHRAEGSEFCAAGLATHRAGVELPGDRNSLADGRRGAACSVARDADGLRGADDRHRLVDALRGVDSVVLAAAGSSDRRALLDCSSVAAELSAVIDRPVEVGYVSGAGERLPAVLARTPGRVAVATYLLAPGFFADRVAAVAARAGAIATAPLGADPRLATLALHRYDQALDDTFLRVS